MLLTDPAYTVPSPGPPGPFGTMAWLRATVSRFAEGETHARRRALAESLLAGLDPAALRDAAAAMARGAAPSGAVAGRGDARRAAAARGDGVERPYIPLAVLAEALGATDAAGAVGATRVVAAAYHPHTDADGADEALQRLLGLLPEGEEELVAARVGLLVQACEATAALVRGDDVPVPVTRRVAPDGEIVLVDLAAHPFGAGPRRCPGEAHARALAEGARAA